MDNIQWMIINDGAVIENGRFADCGLSGDGGDSKPASLIPALQRRRQLEFNVSNMTPD